MNILINYDEVTGENAQEHSPLKPQISGYPHKLLIKGGSGARKTNTIINLIYWQPDTHKIYFYSKCLHESKYKILIKKYKDIGL